MGNWHIQPNPETNEFKPKQESKQKHKEIKGELTQPELQEEVNEIQKNKMDTKV